jgi:hypothetical protein
VITACVAAGFLGTGTHAKAQEDLSAALAATRPLLEMRLRYEGVEQAPLAKSADALTLRTRAGFETGKAWETILLAEAEWVAGNDDFNSTTNGKTSVPTVADPRAFELNRLQLTNTSLPATVITLGRQRIVLDDQRFVGNVGWRQNEQTFDALRVINRSIDGLTVDVTYFDQVNRVFGNNSPQGRYHGDNFLVNAGYQTIFGKISAFGYLIDFREALGRNDSSQTYGARLSGVRNIGGVRLAYVGSYAWQKDYKSSLLNYDTDYYLAELTGTSGPVSAAIGYEVLGGTGTKGFTTPLATLHRFQGWADKFLATPVNGIEDVYGSITYTRPTLGPVAAFSATAAYHTYDSARLSLNYGDEINFQLQGRWNRYTFTLKYADYTASAFATDTKKVWFQIEFAL